MLFKNGTKYCDTASMNMTAAALSSFRTGVENYIDLLIVISLFLW